MKYSCKEIEEAIWELARTSSEPVEDVRRHLDSCAVCSQLFREAKQIMCAASDDYAAAAPDCRSAVRDQIIGVRSRVRFAWVYACATAVLVAVVFGSLSLYAPSSQPQKIAKKLHTAPKVVRVITTPPLTPSIRIAANTKQSKPIVVAVRHRPTLVRGLGMRSPSKPNQYKKPNHVTPQKLSVVAKQPSPIIEEPVAPVEKPRPIAAVIVTGVVGQSCSEESYAYRERDAETGVITDCFVTRNCDSVEIRMESIPGSETPPVKGSIENENTINA